ncbi:MAG: HDIG domain-containing protein [Pirellulales bacterium]|nr:HDIG domain-containing protein [Pirellulales bacterium]
MSLSGQIRTRSERVAALDLPPGPWERAWLNLRRRDIVARIGLAFVSAVVICIVIQGWNPPFGYREGDAPRNGVVARVPFTRKNLRETMKAEELARNQVRYIYKLDPRPLEQLRAALSTTLREIAAAPSLKDLTSGSKSEKWREFQPPEPAAASAKAAEKIEIPAEKKSEKSPEERFREFKSAFTGAEKIEQLDQALKIALAPYERRGLLQKLTKLGKLPAGKEQGNQEEILVYRVDPAAAAPTLNPAGLQTVKVADVLIGDGEAIHDSLRSSLKNDGVADGVFAWLRPKLALAPTLSLDEKATLDSIDKAVQAVPEAEDIYAAGTILAEGGKPLAQEQIALLRMEYAKMLEDRWNTAPMSLLLRGGAVMLMVFVAFLLCGVYTRYRQRTPAVGLGRVFVITLISLATVAFAQWAAADRWHAEIMPLVLFGMTMAIITRRELAMMVTGTLSAVVVLALGEDLSELIVLLGTITTAILCLGGIRSRSKLIYVGLLAGAVAAALNLAMETIGDQPWGWLLLKNSLLTGLWTVAAGFVMTGLLPFVEQAFGVLTDLSLLELGDVAHPLLQELVRRAPSTYNHSVTVGSIAEAAAESIGARGLLCRVGAYFHDIGKMLKPGYFVENQSAEGNRHESLVPAMSTLVIIAHIKDGSDLGRQHHLPQPIIDLIAQHHGTTLVEYFYGRAQRESDPENGEVDESSFRYPGPKPQTKEAAVLMLADAVESASRTLVDPTPARIESIVRELAERRLDDGQFDESGLTLRELRTIERSLAMSLASIYHGRIKYPDQKTA